MGNSELITAVLILLGAGVIIFSAISTRTILSLVKQSKYQRNWRTLFLLMNFFALGYIVALVMLLIGQRALLLTLTGTIFFFGALFVYLVVSVGVLTIQELIDTQTSLRTARDEAVQLSQLKSELLARVSHELRTPLHSILGYSDILINELHGSLGQKQKNMVDRIAVNADRLVGHVNHLLHQAKLESGELSVLHEPMSPKELLEYADLLIAPLIEQKGITYHCSLDPLLPDLLLGDAQMMREIVTNLLGNAIKFTDGGTISIDIFRESEEAWGVRVTDTGIGISIEEQELIFSPFQQADGSITRERGGTGLGLSITKQLITLMGGTIEVESEPNNGSRFSITLPLHAVDVKIKERDAETEGITT